MLRGSVVKGFALLLAGMLCFFSASLPAQAGYWRFVDTKVHIGSPEPGDWIHSASGNGTGAILGTKLTEKSSHEDRGQQLLVKAGWTLPPGIMVPGQKLSFQIELDTLKWQFGSHWQLQQATSLKTSWTDPGPLLAQCSGDEIVSVAVHWAGKNGRSSGEWVVPEGSSERSNLWIVAGTYPAVHRTAYLYKWESSGTPPANHQGPIELGKLNPSPFNTDNSDNSDQSNASGAAGSDTSITIDDSNSGQQNLALNKTASQSSTDYGGDAQRAVDGNTDGSYFANSVTHTGNNAQAWWQVDLGQSCNIRQIRVWNRTDACIERLANFCVLVSDQPFSAADLTSARNQQGCWSVDNKGTAGSPSEFAVNKPGRYVRIQLAETNYLSIAEVEVLGTR
ncbi:MAG: coagulation factor 5/8 type protein [uncultured bacterium]|nr:MAG: coagulation factor 5/8 type protein [uncultured bacterium]